MNAAAGRGVERWQVLVAGLLLGSAFVAARGEGDASLDPRDPDLELPAYSHNDYRRSRPLESALLGGFAGVEVDLHFVRGRLLVGHDLEETRRERTFEAIYLDLLERESTGRGSVLREGREFPLFVDLKTPGMPGYRALRSALASRAPLFTAVRGDSVTRGPVMVVLVGWCPPLDSLRAEETRYVSVHRPLFDATPEDLAAPSHLVRLISLDASKLPGWSGKGGAPAAWKEAFERLRAAGGEGPERITRVHHLRVNARLYAYALERGVDLIGSESLGESRRILLELRN